MHRNGAEVVGRFHHGVLAADVASDAPDGPVGSLRYGGVFNGRPHVFETWLVLSTDLHVVSRVVELLGGTPSGSHDGGQEPYVITDATEVDILLTGPDEMNVGWHRQPGHGCDGTVQHDRRGSHPCACPPNLADRTIAARAGHGCRPRVRVYFRLLRGPALGTFTFSSGNRAFAEQASNALASLRRDPRPTCARLSLRRTPYRLRSGTTINYTRPALELLGPAR